MIDYPVCSELSIVNTPAKLTWNSLPKPEKELLERKDLQLCYSLFSHLFAIHATQPVPIY